MYSTSIKHIVMDNLIAILYQSPKTILTSKDLALLWGETNRNNLKSKISYYVKQGDLIRLTRGVFAKDKNYNSKELATSIYTPSYISFESVLREEGMVFQYYDAIFVAGPWSKTMVIDSTTIIFRTLKDTVLFNGMGIENKGTYGIASAERAFLDMIYLFPDYHFDNLRPVNWDKCFDLVSLYGNEQLVRRLRRYQKKYAE